MKIKDNKSFWMFKNAISVGYHLRVLQELDSEFMGDKDTVEAFLKWMKVHKMNNE